MLGAFMAEHTNGRVFNVLAWGTTGTLIAAAARDFGPRRRKLAL
jgi:hypothetical protein